MLHYKLSQTKVRALTYRESKHIEATRQTQLQLTTAVALSSPGENRSVSLLVSQCRKRENITETPVYDSV